MGSEWQRYSFEDCMDAIIDYRGKTPKKTESGVPLITAKIIKNGCIQPVTEFIAEDDYDSWMRRGIPEPGDIVLTTEAPLGEVAQLDNRKVALAQRVITLRGKKGFLDNTFLKYLLLSNDVQHQLDGRGTGTTVKGIKQSELRKIELQLPEFSVQKKIAHALDSLDKKIQLNRETNQTLENMAQALFKSWFVDFDPVIDNALAAGNPIPEPLQARAAARKARAEKIAAQKNKEQNDRPQNQSAAANAPSTNRAHNADSAYNDLFPSEFEETEELGWVPKGWEKTELGGHIKLSTGPSFKSKDFLDKGIKLARGDNVKEGSFHWGNKTRYWDANDHLMQKHLLSAGDVLLGMDGSKVGKNRVRVTKSDLPCLLVQRVACLRPKNTISSAFIYLLVNGQRFRDYVEIIKTGSAIPHISGKQIKEYSIVLSKDPNCKVVQKFNELIDALYSVIDRNVIEAETLRELRDTLLPKLISGELRLPDSFNVDAAADQEDLPEKKAPQHG